LVLPFCGAAPPGPLGGALRLVPFSPPLLPFFFFHYMGGCFVPFGFFYPLLIPPIFGARVGKKKSPSTTPFPPPNTQTSNSQNEPYHSRLGGGGFGGNFPSINWFVTLFFSQAWFCGLFPRGLPTQGLCWLCSRLVPCLVAS